MTHTQWILVPIDFSNDSKLALIAADEQADARKNGLIVLHVQETGKRPRKHPHNVEQWKRYVRHTPESRVAYMTVAGDPVEEILSIAGQCNVSKIILGRGGDREQVGSLAEDIARRFPGLVQLVSEHHSDVVIHASKHCVGA